MYKHQSIYLLIVMGSLTRTRSSARTINLIDRWLRGEVISPKIIKLSEDRPSVPALSPSLAYLLGVAE